MDLTCWRELRWQAPLRTAPASIVLTAVIVSLKTAAASWDAVRGKGKGAIEDVIERRLSWRRGRKHCRACAGIGSEERCATNELP